MVGYGEACAFRRERAMEERHLGDVPHEHVGPFPLWSRFQQDVSAVEGEALGVELGGWEGDAPQGLDRVDVQLDLINIGHFG